MRSPKPSRRWRRPRPPSRRKRTRAPLASPTPARTTSSTRAPRRARSPGAGPPKARPPKTGPPNARPPQAERASRRPRMRPVTAGRPDLALAPPPGARASPPASRAGGIAAGNGMRLLSAELIDSREILPGQYLQTYLAPELALTARAGQFVHMRTPDYSGLVLRRPFSVNTADRARGLIT